MVNELNKLIQVLEEKINKKDDSIRGVKHPKLLLKSLRDLDNIIGMENLKNSIALQTMKLIIAVNKGEKNLGMLNTILYGPPGVGKTTVAKILANIWYALGFLNGGKTKKSTWKASFKDSSPDDVNMLLFILIIVLSYMFSLCQFVYAKLGMYYSLVILAVVLVLILSVLVYYNYSSEREIIVEETKESSGTESILKTVSRRDFVGDYVGQTAGKTKALLEANIGKVVFIDEAYSLLNDSKDPYGLEALTTLNLFMSEHDGEEAFIFAGYKDKMQHGIFAAQPGLPRRCMWHFQCDVYNGKELTDIFELQMRKAGWTLEDKEDVERIITKYKHLFPSYGGDTERLGNFSQLESSRNEFMSGKSNGNVLTTRDIISGLKKLRDNNIHAKQTDVSPEYASLRALSSILNNDDLH